MFGRSHHRAISVSRNDVSEARFKRFLQDLSAYERQVTFEETRDVFLDLYSTWLKTHEPWIKIQVVMLAFELHRIDPEFRFDLNFTNEGRP